MPQISVIVPVYNVEPYIHRCIDSILAQTFTDFELILVDDGSPDNCGKICDEYAEKDSRIHVIHKNNGGLSAARNTGIALASGQYICFVDSDDIISRQYCEVLHGLLKNTDYDFSVCGVHRFADGTVPSPEMAAPQERTVDNTAFAGMQLNRETEFGVCNKLFRRELFEKISFAEGRINEDVIFSADLLKLCQKGAVLTGQQLYYYRQRSSGIVGEQHKRASPDRIYAGEYLLNAVTEATPIHTERALHYAVHYPWMFVDRIYVQHSFRVNREYLTDMQEYLRRHIREYSEREVFDPILTGRIKLFAHSQILYAFNAYARLLRVYLYRLIGKDAYQDGHGI